MLYFVRHGETDYNKNKIIQGQLDIPLNETGINQAKAVAEDLKDYNFDVIYCSPLSRAKVTAETINKYHNVPIIFDDRLKEFDAGKREGMPFSSWEKTKNVESIVSPNVYGGETNQDVFDRASAFFKEIENSDKNILIVSHNGVYRALYRYVNGLAVTDNSFPPIKNCVCEVLK